MEWISVKHSLPKPTTVVLVYLPEQEFGLRTLGYLYQDEWYNGTKSFKGEVTHWMPLPEPPKIDL